MIFTTKDIVKREVEALAQDVKETLAAKGINNKGNASASLRVEADDKTVTLLAVEYLEYLDRGRPPGKFPPVDAMRDWVRTKLGVSDEKEINSVAYLVGRKIAAEGTEIYNNNSKGIEFDEKVAAMVERLRVSLAVGAKADVQNLLRSIKV